MAAARAHAHYVGGQFEEAVSWATKALARNPRSTRTLRILAASLVGAGERERAAEVIRELLATEPELTISKWRVRNNFWRESDGRNYAEALRLAGLPE